MSDRALEQMKLDFIADASETVRRLSKQVVAFDPTRPAAELVDSMFRAVHSLRGTAGMFDLGEVSRIAVSLENLLEALRSQTLNLDAGVVGLILEAMDEISSLLRHSGDNDDRQEAAGVIGRLEGLLETRGRSRSPQISAEPADQGRLLDRQPNRERTAEPQAPSLAVKVDLALLDTIMNNVSELLSAKHGLAAIASRLPHIGATRKIKDDVIKMNLLLTKQIADLEASVTAARLVPLSLLFDRFEPEVRRLARRSGKQIRLSYQGEATRLDSALLEKLYDPLLHLIRNAVDHGIEPPSERAAAGKPEEGTVVLRAEQESGYIRIDVGDDGRGIDLDQIRQAALRRGLVAGGRESPLDLLFTSGVTTKTEVTDLSGRGVGLDAVRRRVEEVKGLVSMDTRPGAGTRFSLWVPLTLTLTKGILVEEQSVPVALPLSCVVEVLRVGKSMLGRIGKTGSIAYRGGELEVVDLAGMLGLGQGSRPRCMLVVGVADRRKGVLVEKVRGRIDVVARPLPDVVMACSLISCVAELADGRPAIVVRPDGLFRLEQPSPRHSGRFGSHPSYTLMRGVFGTDEPREHLIFKHADETYAIGLDLVEGVITSARVTEVPAVGLPCRGLFFVRGVCHCLLDLGTAEGSTSDPENLRYLLVLRHPHRCGIAASAMMGHATLAVTRTPPSKDHSHPLIVRGAVVHEGRSVRVLDVVDARVSGGGKPVLPAQASPAGGNITTNG